ncbi:DUF3102 domain-containing protein [Jeotgalibaca porci]|uniref:DUF3102 domain-containing protein n=1 Tax=Jeotgalibaca porci TaxID=1868793 RepID=UPI00359F5909
MNEITLSGDIKQIELEINHHKNIAGQSIWEIGRRLNHVKENDLVHGEFMSWYESIGIDKDFASKSMKVAKELPNFETFRNLGATALSLIATLPEEERTKEHTTEKGEVKTPDEMTVRELQELKRKLKIAEQDKATKQEDIDRLIKRNNDLINLINTEPKVVEVEKEVVPDDYHELKRDKETLEHHLKLAKESAEYLEKQHKELLKQREEVNQKSVKYDELTQAIQRAEGNLDDYQQKLVSAQNLLIFVNSGKELLVAMSGLIYQDFQVASDFELGEVEKVVGQVQSLIDDVRVKMHRKQIIEGEIINE